MWGGPVPDPVQVLSALIADLRTRTGPDIPKLYKDVAKTARSSSRIRKLPFDEKKFKKEGGLRRASSCGRRRGIRSTSSSGRVRP